MLAVFAIGVYIFFTYKTFQLKKTVIENKINHQNDALCFRKILINKTSDCDDQNNKKPTDGVDATTVKKPIADGLMITTLTTTTAAIFLGPRLGGMTQGNALLT